MVDLDDLIAEAQQEASIQDKLGDGFSEGSEERAFYYGHRDRYKRLADALEAATSVPVKGEPNDDREVLAKVMDTLAYYHCRAENPKADHPRMGYHAMSEDQREFLQERQREAAEEILRMIPALSRATVPDAATEAFDKAVALSERRQTLLEEAEVERDAAVAALERVRALHPVAYSGNSRSRNAFCATCTTSGPCPTVAALDGAPEPEVKP